MKNSKILIYEYLDFRNFLNDLVEDLRQQKLFSSRDFAKKAGFKSNSYLRMIIQGKRNLSKDAATRVASAFEMLQTEKDFFFLLVQLDQASSLAEKDRCLKEIFNFKQFRKGNPRAISEYDYFSNWYMLPIWEALGTNWRNKPEAFQAWSLGIKVSELRDALSKLEQIGLIKQNSRGKWESTDQEVETTTQTKSLAIRNFHRGMIQKAEQAVDEVDAEFRHLGSLTMTLTEEHFQELKEGLHSYLLELNRRYSADKQRKQKRKVYQLNVQLFPVLEIDK